VHNFIFSLVLPPGETTVSALREHLGYYETFSGLAPMVVQNLAQFAGIYWTYAYSCLE